jgi:Ribbon-helix-helix protein, copG family
VLSLLKRKPKPAVLINPPVQETPRRDRQQNIKVSVDCAAAFAALAQAQGLSKAAFFEDMVAERLEAAGRQGVRLKIE